MTDEKTREIATGSFGWDDCLWCGLRPIVHPESGSCDECHIEAMRAVSTTDALGFALKAGFIMLAALLVGMWIALWR